MLLLLPEMPLYLFGVHQGRNHDVHKRIDDFSSLQCYFNRIRTGEINFRGFVVSVGAAISDVFHRSEDFFDFGLQFQSLNLLPQPRITFVIVNFSQIRNYVAQSLKTYTQKSACRPRRELSDTQSFYEDFFNRFRHVFAWIDTNRLRIDNFPFAPHGDLSAMGAFAHCNGIRNRFGFFVWHVVNKADLHSGWAISDPRHLATDAAMRASET